jgi:hypothetical protein
LNRLSEKIGRSTWSESAKEFLKSDPKFIIYREKHSKVVLDERVILLRLETIRFSQIKRESYKAVSCNHTISGKEPNMISHFLHCNAFVQILKEYAMLEHFKQAVSSCESLGSDKHPLLFENVTDVSSDKKLKRSNLLGQSNKKIVRDMMTFVVRLHYANYLNRRLYKVKSKFNFKTYPSLRLVFNEMEYELGDLEKRRVKKIAKLAPAAALQAQPVAENAFALEDEQGNNEGLSTVVGNVCTALRQFEKYVRDSTK